MHDHIGLYNQRHASHKQCVQVYVKVLREHNWLSDTWINELSTWELLPRTVHGATILTANAMV